jgi:hypothetical protein
MKKSTLITILIVIILAVAGIAYYNDKKPQTDNGIVKNTPRTLVTYSNNTYGVSFQYPDYYALEERSVGAGQNAHYAISLITKADKEAMASSTPPGEGPTAITMDIYPNKTRKLTPEKWIRQTDASNFKLSPDGYIATSTVERIPMFAYSWTGLYSANSVVFAHKDNIVMTTMTFLTGEDPIWQDFSTVIQTLQLK